jgi:hypothetical protein
MGALNGQVGLSLSNGVVEPPESATVYVFFSRRMENNADSFEGRPTFWHGNNLDTAGGQFQNQLNNLLEKNKALKSLIKAARHHPGPDDADQIAAYYLQSVDEALIWVRGWLAKHLDRSWQMKTIVPDGRGFWSAESLQPGGYDVVVRGKLSGHDADWEGTVDLGPGRTISMPITRPRFFRPNTVQPK